MRLADTRFARLLERLRQMGDELRIPDKRGIAIPVAALSVLVGVMMTLGGVLFRAGQIVNAQAAQAREWETIKAKIEAVDEIEGRLAAMDQSQSQFRGFVTDWIRQNDDEQIEQKATLVAFREDMRRQERDRRLLQDYVEGRIGTMPYRPSINNRGPQE